MRLLHYYWLIGIGVVLVLSSHSFVPAGDSKSKTEKKTDEKKSAPPIDPTDEAILRRANLTTEPDALLAFLRKRILPEDERPAIEQLVRRLGSGYYRTRAKAMRDIITRGIATMEVLRTTSGDYDAEVVRRIEASIQTIQENDVGAEVPAAVIRVLAQHDPKDLVAALIDYAPFADNDTVLDEIRGVLQKHATPAGRSSTRLVAALTDRAAIRRACAGEALARTARKDQAESLRKLRDDPDPTVRWRVARAQVLAADKDAVPTLIDALVDLPLNAAWQAEDLLLQVAGKLPPAAVSMGSDADTRAKCKESWRAWWKKHAGEVQLARADEAPVPLGRTLVVLLDQGRVLELGRDNTPRWDIKNLVFPLDAQVISDDRVLVAEYHANRVTERDVRGQIVWQKAVAGPLAAQRLPNGNTFVATDHSLFEFDKDGGEVVHIEFPDEGRKIMKASKLPNGEFLCMLADSRIARFDARGKEVHNFQINLGMRLFGGRIYAAPNGRVLVPHHSEGKVIEYDAKGKAIWEIAFDQPIAAVRLANGNTLITSMNAAVGAVEVDRAGVEVWSYRQNGNSRVTRAIRR